MKLEQVEVNSERWFDLTPLLNEEFRDIKGYENLYQVSNYGRIKSLSRDIKTPTTIGKTKEKIKKLNYHKQGYLLVSLSKKCKKKTYQVHRLVAQAFIPNPDNLPEINHKKAQKDDNRVTELEWCTRLYNQKEAERLGLVKSPMRIKGKDNPKNKIVYQFDENGTKINEYYSLLNASNTIGVNFKHLSYCIIKKRKDKKTNSYWKYKEV